MCLACLEERLSEVREKAADDFMHTIEDVFEPEEDTNE